MTETPIVSTIPAPKSDRMAMIAMMLIFAVALVGAVTTLALI